MFPDPNPLRTRLAAGQSIHGLYVQIPSPDMVELAAVAGYDYVILDEEHGALEASHTVRMIRAAEARGVCALVRVPALSPTRIRKALEAGALGIYVPDVRTAEDARTAVAAIKFGEAGSHGRGVCPTVRAALGANDAQGLAWEAFVRWNDQNVLAC